MTSEEPEKSSESKDIPFLTSQILPPIVLIIECISVFILLLNRVEIDTEGEFYDTMNVLFSWSGEIQNLGPAIYAFINAHPNQHITFYLTTTQSKYIRKYRAYFDKWPIHNVKFFFEVHQTKYLAKRVIRVPYDAYIRLLFPNAHPGLERFLYLDGDANVLHNINDMYYYDFQNKSAIVILDHHPICEGFSRYFNSGVMMFNNWKYVRENCLKQAEDYLEWLEKNKGVWFNDQTPLNKIFEHNRIEFPQDYNEWNMTRFSKNTKIAHFYDNDWACKPYKASCNRTDLPFELWRCFYKAFKEQPNLWRYNRSTTICTNNLL